MSQEKLLLFCRSNNIELTAYSPLGSPGKVDLTRKEPLLIEDPLIKALAKKYSRPQANILIRYQLQRNVIVIPKAIQKAHLESNLEALNFELSRDDMRKLDSLNRNHRLLKFERCMNHKYYPYNEI